MATGLALLCLLLLAGSAQAMKGHREGGKQGESRYARTGSADVVLKLPHSITIVIVL